MANIKVGNTNITRMSVIEPYDDSTPSDNDETQPWVRPSHWLDMPVMNSGDEKISCLLAIPSGERGNFRVVVYGTKVSGSSSHTYSLVDWGDNSSGVISAYSNYAAYLEHVYDFDSLDPSTEFIHDGLPNRQVLLNIDNSASGCWYFTTFHLGPNSASEGTTLLNSKGNSTRVLELNIASDTLTNLSTYANSYPRNRMMQRIKIIGDCKLDTLSNLFYDNNELQSIELPSGIATNTTACTYMFNNCLKLKTAPWFDTSSLTNMSSMFASCHSLRNVPQYDTSNNNNFDQFYFFCRTLRKIPYLDHSSSISSYREYSYCFDLEEIPSGIDYSNTTNTREMFYSCANLRYVPSDLFSTMQNVTDSRSMMSYCRSLKSVPAINLPSTTQTHSLLAGCISLKEAEIENLSSVTTDVNGINSLLSYCHNLEKVTFNNPEDINASQMQYMFYECYRLKSAPYFNTASGTRLTNMFGYCHNMEYAPKYDLTSATDVNTMFRSCYALKKIAGFNTINSNIAYMPNIIYDCASLEEMPSGLFDGSAPIYRIDNFLYNNNKILFDFNEDIVASGYYTFRQNYGLKSVSRFTPSGDCQHMFRSCSQLRTLGDLDFTHATNLTNWFYGAGSQLMWSDIKNVSVDHSYAAFPLSSGAIANIINNLPTVASTKTVTFTNCWGTTTLHPDTIAIGTSKGWTVTT